MYFVCSHHLSLHKLIWSTSVTLYSFLRAIKSKCWFVYSFICIWCTWKYGLVQYIRSEFYFRECVYLVLPKYWRHFWISPALWLQLHAFQCCMWTVSAQYFSHIWNVYIKFERMSAGAMGDMAHWVFLLSFLFQNLI